MAPVITLNAVDYAIIGGYILVMILVGFSLKKYMKTGEDFFLSGRSLPGWITGLAFLSANLGALEVIGMVANSAKYGIATVHFYWVGAVLAMAFLGVFMMPFYYGSRVRTVPEYLKLRYNEATRGLNAISFAIMTILMSGISLYAMALLFNKMLGWSFHASILFAALVVLLYVFWGGLSSSIYNEVIQFFLIWLGLLPIVFLGLKQVGGFAGLTAKLNRELLHAVKDLGTSNNPLGADWFGVVLGLGFVLSFGYWTTDFPEVQRALASKNLNSARRTPLIAAFPKMFVPAVVIPGLVARSSCPSSRPGRPAHGRLQRGPHPAHEALPAQRHAGPGHHGPARQLHGRHGRQRDGVQHHLDLRHLRQLHQQGPARRPLRQGPQVDHGHRGPGLGRHGVHRPGFKNLMDYMQLIFSFFNAPLFATFLLAMFWKGATPWGGFWGLLVGILTAAGHYILYKLGILSYHSEMAANFYQAIWAWSADFVVTIGVSLFTAKRDPKELVGLVFGLTPKPKVDARLRPAGRLGDVGRGLVRPSLHPLLVTGPGSSRSEP